MLISHVFMRGSVVVVGMAAAGLVSAQPSSCDLSSAAAFAPHPTPTNVQVAVTAFDLNHIDMSAFGDVDTDVKKAR